MSAEIRIPKLGISMTEAVLAKWLVPDGAAVEVGTPLYSMEGDKAVQDVESPAAGVLRIIGAAGETFEVGDIVASIE